MAWYNFISNLLKSSSFQGVESHPAESQSFVTVDGQGRSASSVTDALFDEYSNAFVKLSRTDMIGKWPTRLYQLSHINPYAPSKNFTWDEVACRDKDRSLPNPQDLIHVYRVCDLLEEVRYLFGNLPITVLSWYRTDVYNKQVGGAKHSQHLRGAAVDFTVRGISPKQVQAKLLKNRDKLGGMGGLGCYPTFTHIDVGPKRTWVKK